MVSNVLTFTNIVPAINIVVEELTESKDTDGNRRHGPDRLIGKRIQESTG